MKTLSVLIAVLILFVLTVCALGQRTADSPVVSASAAAPSANGRREDSRAKNKTPVLVELFTSEGCAACPPVERNLATLDREQPSAEAEIITLALHVDYWNRQGWTDVFSSPIFTQRQQIYGSRFKIGSIYTPQLVVDGSRHFVGTNLGEAQKSIAEAAKAPKAKVELSLAGDKLRVKISGAPKHEIASVYLAIAEDDLTNDVKKGENGGRTLRHVSVVRRLHPLGRMLPQENEFEIETVLSAEAEWKRENLKAVVFVQENQSRKILGAARTAFQPEPRVE